MQSYSYSEWPRIVGMLEDGWYLIILSKTSYHRGDHRFVAYPKGERCFYLDKVNSVYQYHTLAFNDLSKVTHKLPLQQKDFRGIICLGFKNPLILEHLLVSKMITNCKKA